MSELTRLGMDLYNLVEAYRAKLPAGDIKALARDIVSRIRTLAPGTKLGFALFFRMEEFPARTSRYGMDVDRVCDAVNKVEVTEATPSDLEAIDSASGYFRLVDEPPVEFESPMGMSLYDRARDVGGAGKPESPEPVVKPDPVAVAVALKKQHPDWSDRKIATQAGCNASTLSRDDFYQRVKAAFASDAPPRGTRDRESGDVEAFDE